ncbi:MAG: hypothetical protein HAW67_06075 [Endozoicomonadaceae bacterium]|nr:hypothetical protein [Endozoicomonadaceae bacterium]
MKVDQGIEFKAKLLGLTEKREKLLTEMLSLLTFKHIKSENNDHYIDYLIQPLTVQLPDNDTYYTDNNVVRVVTNKSSGLQNFESYKSIEINADQLNNTAELLAFFDAELISTEERNWDQYMFREFVLPNAFDKRPQHLSSNFLSDSTDWAPKEFDSLNELFLGEEEYVEAYQVTIENILNIKLHELITQPAMFDLLIEQYTHDNFSCAFNFEADIMTKRNAALPKIIQEHIHDYHPWELNFIASGKSTLNRKHFIDQCHNLVNQGDKGAWDRLHGDRRLPNHFYNSLFINDEIRGIQHAVFQIDNGTFPLPSIQEKFGLKSLSKKQLQSSLFHTKNSITGGEHLASVIVKQIYLSMLPTNWIDPEIYTNQYDSKGINIEQWLTFCAKQIDGFKNELNKDGLKQLAKEWSWLTNNQQSTVDSFNRIQKKYGGETLYDGQRILSDTLLDIQNRVLLENTDIFNPACSFDKSDLSLSINESKLGHLRTNTALTSYDTKKPIFFRHGVLSDFLRGNFTMISNLKANSEFHKTIGRLQRNLASYHTESLAWSTAIDEPYNDDHFIIKAIGDRQSLTINGLAMDHCVGTYASACLQGDTHIFTITEAGGNECAATLNLSYYDDKWGNNPTYHIEELKGVRNSEVSKLLHDSAAQFVAKLNTNKIKNNPVITPDTTNLYDKMLDNKLENYCNISNIPYHTDAVFLAALNIEQLFTTYFNGLSIESAFENTTDSFGKIYKESIFHKELNHIKNLAIQSNIEPELIIDTKTAYSLNSFDDATSVIAQNMQISRAIFNSLKAMPSHSSEEGVNKLIADHIKQDFGHDLPKGILGEINVTSTVNDITIAITNSVNENRKAENQSGEIALPIAPIIKHNATPEKTLGCNFN